MHVLDFLLCIVISPFTPFIYFLNLVLDKNIPKVNSNQRAFNICVNVLRKNATKNGILASPNEYTDVWTRDAFFSLMGLKHVGLDAKQATVDTLEDFQRHDGLIPLYIGRGNACSKLICKSKPTGCLKATYGDSKTGNVVTDSCFQFIIMKGKSESSERAWKFMQQFVKDGLIYEEGLGSWMDTVYHKGNVLYTNVLYYKAAQTLGDTDTAETIKQRLQCLWNGSYYNCSTSIKSFDQVGNALAIKWGIADEKKNSIIKYRKRFFTKGLSNPPCIPPVQDIYLPCYMIGNQNYHNFGWTWVNLLFISVMKDETELQKFRKEIQDRGTVYEIYEDDKPVNQLFCVSQPDFSEAAGMFLLCSNQKVDFFTKLLKPHVSIDTGDSRDLYKWLAFIFIATSGVIQAIRSVVIHSGTLSFWSQACVGIGSIFQIVYFSLEGNWQFILIQLGIMALTVMNIVDIVDNNDNYLGEL